MIIVEGHHSLASDLKQIHQIVEAKFQIRKQASVDEKRAKKMEQYLRMFKIAGNKKDETKPSYQSFLEGDAMEEIAMQVGTALNIKDYSLFRMKHNWYLDSNARWGADDVFEAELARLLEIAGQKASNNTSANISMGINIIGGQSGNISQKGLKDFDKMLLNSTMKDFGETVSENAQNLVDKTKKPSDFLTPPVARSAKVDVTGYNTSWVISAEIQPQWQDFIKTFTGAKFTVKNYSSDSQIETIHLGNSDLYKAFYGTIAETLNIKPRTAATHTYFHAINSNHTNDAEVSPHILHIRFIYELTGGGLYTIDSSGKEQKLDSADFFIYNDPASNNIWVRSTKSMIAHFINSENIQSVRDPLHSGIVVLKNSFN